MKFECPKRPPHHKCKDILRQHRLVTRHGSKMIKWAPCREPEAIEFMKTEYNYNYISYHVEDRGKSKHSKSHDKRPSTKQSTPPGPSLNQQNLDAFQEAIDQQDELEQEAAARQQNQHPQQFPAKAKYMPPVNQGHIRDWMGGHIDSSQGMGSGQGMVPPQGTHAAGAQNMAAAPVMPSPQEAMPGGQQQKHRHHKSSHRPKHEHGGQHHRHHRDRASQEPNPEQGLHPSAIMSPDASEGLVGTQPVLQAPVMYPPQAPSDGQRHRRRHHKSNREPESGPEQYPQPGPSMPVPPGMPSAQDVVGGQQLQHHRREPSVYYSHHHTPLSPADMPPPPTMRECMAVLAEEAMSAPAEEPQVGGMVTDPRMSSMPPPMNPMMSAPPTRNTPMRHGPQPGPGMSPAPPAAGMYGPRSTQLPPTGAPQAGGITTAAGPSRPPSQNLPLRQPRPQPTNPGMFLRSAGAAGTPGAQAMALRPAPGALSATPGMPLNPSMQPPPTSMPPFPGTGPGTPASLDLARAPPPPAPTPPFPPGALD